MRRRDGEPVRADLVRDIPVRSDAIGAREHRVDLARGHECRRCSVHDHGERDTQLLELPRREPAALEERPCLVDPDVLDPSCLPGCANRSERRAVAPGRQRTRVAVRQDPRPGSNERERMLAHGATSLDLRVVQGARSFGRRIGTKLVEGPAEVHGGRARRDQHVVRGVEILLALSRQCQAVPRCNTDRRRPADGERPNRVGNLRR